MSSRFGLKYWEKSGDFSKQSDFHFSHNFCQLFAHSEPCNFLFSFGGKFEYFSAMKFFEIVAKISIVWKRKILAVWQGNFDRGFSILD
jgi:hypothetical protein